jgi:hypothetical protein
LRLGDVEYLFAVNATPDNAARNDKGEPVNNQLLPITATITLPDDDRPVYDAMSGGPATGFVKQDGRLVGTFRFGPGQMRVFARTRSHMNAVLVARPIVTSDLTNDAAPIQLHIAATLHAGESSTIAGSVPLRVSVIDPLGVTRFDLFRATKLGQFSIDLPLAANDPAGEWLVVVRELLGGNVGDMTFVYTPPRRANSIGGATWRAVFAAGDDDKVFRFARTHQDVTIVAGSSDFNAAAAERLTKILAPWGVRCRTMPLAEAAKSRTLTEEEARTWAGLSYAGSGQIKPGGGNSPAIAGFAVQGPVILLGNPEDNPLIDFLAKEKFLPHAVAKEKFPGIGRGMFAWQRDGVGPGQESIALIAYDAVGMSEAVGSVYEAAAGIQPVTRWRQPSTVDLAPVTKATLPPQPTKIELVGALPDRVVGLSLRNGQLRALAHDGSLLQAPLAQLRTATANRSVALPIVNPGEFAGLQAELATPVDASLHIEFQKYAPPTRLLKFTITYGQQLVGVYWGGHIESRQRDGRLIWRTRFDQDITALASDGGAILVGLANGRLWALQ